MKKVKDNLLNIYVIINILFIFICSFTYIGLNVPYYYFGRAIIWAFIFNVVIAIIMLIKKITNKEYNLRIYDFLLVGIIIFLIISFIFSINRDVALYGFEGRYEGLFSLIYYLSLTYLCSFVKKKDKKKIIYVLLFTGVFQAIYALLQINEIKLVSLAYNLGDIWANGLTTNPNFFGSYMLLCLGYALGLFAEEEKKVPNIIYGIILVILLIGLLISNTTSCAVGLIIITSYLFIYLLKKKKVEKILIILIMFILTSVTVNNFDKTTLFSDLMKTKDEAVELAKGNGNDNFGTKRMKVWRETMKIVPENIIHGVGIDNYFYAFGKIPLIIGRNYYDKAHNEYLQILITEGIFALLLYLTLYFISVFRGIKITYKDESIYLLLPVVGYLIQAFFNISVIEVAPIFFISLGLLIDREENISVYTNYLKRLFDILFSLILLIVLLPFFIIVAIIIKIKDKDKVFYTQIRTGKDGKEFKIYKFRTIKDKKVTKVGNVLRNSSIDELPQLINILKGDMSFIGPRPWIVDYYELFNKKQKRRVEVRPGITGLAQVNGRNNIDVFKKIDYDLEYIDNISFLLDLKILFKSIKTVFNSDESIDMDKNIKKELSKLKNQKNKKK